MWGGFSVKRNEMEKRQNLAGADLSGLSLGCMDLSGKNLRGADLSYAHLGYAKLMGADLRNANLRNANMGAANLSGADLRYCDLTDANLAGAILDGTDFRDSIGKNSGEALPQPRLVDHIFLEETQAYQKAQEEGYLPVGDWAHQYRLEDGDTLNRALPQWKSMKRRLGGVIFGDRQAFSEVRLVQQYKHYSQWAYMISKQGFERIADLMGLRIAPRGRHKSQ